jgi:hypothetical protein
VTITEHQPEALPNRHARRRATAPGRRGDPQEKAAAAEYVNEDGLAERYLIPPRTAQRWRASGEGPPFIRLGKRRVLYRIADVEAWLAAKTFGSRADELARTMSAAEG